MQYEIQGTPFPVVICELKKGEKINLRYRVLVYSGSKRHDIERLFEQYKGE